MRRRTILGCVLLLAAGAIFARHAAACDEVVITPLHDRIDFGNLRMPTGASGWLVLDPAGGIAASGLVNLASGKRPVPAEVRVEAVAGQRLLMQMEHVPGAGADASAGISRLAIAVDGRMQPDRGGAFEVSMPTAATGKLAAVRISIGADLQIHHFRSPLILRDSIRLRCLSRIGR